MVRTGYEHVIAHRVDAKFAGVAKDDGIVVDKSNHHLSIKYKDGTIENFPIGEFYGISGGHHTYNGLFSDYQVKQKVKAGDVVTFNPKFFSRDRFVKGQVLFKYSTVVRTAYIEMNDTHEDSCAISERMDEALSTEVIKVRTLVVPFDNEIYNLVREGTELESDDIICTLADAVFSSNTMFDEDDLAALGELAQSTPRAKYNGVVSKIEVFYKGEPDTATESVQNIIDRYDGQRRKIAKLMKDGRAISGKLNETIRIDKEALDDNKLLIRIFIKAKDNTTTGD